VDLAATRLFVADSKTDAGVRYVELLPALRDVLSTYKAARPAAALEDFVFPTSTGHQQGQDNFRERVFDRSVRLADERRVAAGLSPLPKGLTPHKLRHTCCGLLFACGWELPRVMAFMGHSDVTTTLRIYGARHGDRPGRAQTAAGDGRGR
jgi:integrase